MRFLVLSHTHSLLPFAYRLQIQGHEVQPVVTVSAFEAAWHGKMEPSPRDQKGRLDSAFLDKTAKTAVEEDLVVLTDDWKLQERFRQAGVPANRMFGVSQQHHTITDGPSHPLRFGGWFDGQRLLAHHCLIVDRGAWPGGMGPAIDAGLTLIRVDKEETRWMLESLCEVPLEELREVGFRGLVQFGLNFQTKTGEPEVDRMVAGWPFLQTHAFLSELEDFSDLLSGEDTPSSTTDLPQLIPQKFVTVLPISRPPWPTRKARFRFDLAPIEGLTSQQMARVFWHDVQVHPEVAQLTTAGLDGLIGVIRGAADTSELARARALEVALRVQLPEKQFRSDFGLLIQSTLAELEGRFGVLL
jgi:hypothetical protein